MDFNFWNRGKMEDQKNEPVSGLCVSVCVRVCAHVRVYNVGAKFTELLT